MNNEFKQQELNKHDNYKQKYNLIAKTQDNVFGKIKLFNNDQDDKSKLIGVKKIKTDTEEEHADTIEFARERLALNHPNLLKMLDFSAHHKEQKNKNQHRTNLVFEIPKMSLDYDLANRKKNKHYYSDKDIIDLGEDILNGIKFLRINEKSHNNISPPFIALKEEKHKNRLIDCFVEDKDNEEIQIEYINQKKNIYQSPSLFKCLISGQGTYDRYKTDLFSLGLVILEMACLKSVQGFYDFKNKDIRADFLIGLISEFLQRYGKNKSLRNLVLMLLDINEGSRRGVREIYKVFLADKRKTNARKLLGVHEDEGVKNSGNIFQNSNNNQRGKSRERNKNPFIPNEMRSKSAMVNNNNNYQKKTQRKSKVYGDVDIRQNNEINHKNNYMHNRDSQEYNSRNIYNGNY